MSRTEKDAPWWYQAQWWKPVHNRCVNARPSWKGAWLPSDGRPCTLPENPEYPLPSAGVFPRVGCYWWPVWPFRCTCSYCRPRHSRGERAAVRDFGRRAAAEHRATRTVDAELSARPAGPHWCDW